MNVLITGASGFVGSNLAKYLVERSFNVTGLVHDSHSIDGLKLLATEDKITTVQGSVTCFDLMRRIMTDYDIDVVYHIAAQPIVRRAELDPIGTWTTNVIGTLNVCEALRLVDKGALLVFLSTDKVYGDLPRHIGGDRVTYLESDPLNAQGVYDLSKAAADRAVQTYVKVYGMQGIVLRACNLYGPADLNPRIIPNTIRSCLSGKNPVIYKNSTYHREYLYINDLMEAFMAVLSRRARHTVYNVGTGQTATQDELVHLILKFFDRIQPEYKEPEEFRSREITDQLLSSERFHNEFGWEARHPLGRGLELTVNWWKENWDVIRNRSF